MNFLDTIQESLIDNYREHPGVNASLLKELKNGNYEAAINGIPEKTSKYLDFGSYIDKVLTRDNLDIYTYPEVTLTGHSLELAESIITKVKLGLLKFPVTDADKLQVANDKNLWSSTKNEDKRLILVQNPDIDTVLNKEHARLQGKDVISEEDKNLGDQMINTLCTHEYSKEYFMESKGIELFNQVAIEFPILLKDANNVVINTIVCKTLLDIIKVDHNEKTIEPVDLKTGSYFNFRKNFYEYDYEIQACLYYMALLYLKHKYEALSDYKILPFKFLYISREKPNLPLVHSMSQGHLEKCIEGFNSIKGYYYKGIIDYIKEYSWHKSTGIVDKSYETYLNNGVLELPTPM